MKRHMKRKHSTNKSIRAFWVTPEERGWWYEAKITGWKCTSSNKSLICSILAKDSVPDFKIVFIDKVMALEKPQILAAMVDVTEEDQSLSSGVILQEEVAIEGLLWSEWILCMWMLRSFSEMYL